MTSLSKPFYACSQRRTASPVPLGRRLTVAVAGLAALALSGIADGQPATSQAGTAASTSGVVLHYQGFVAETKTRFALGGREGGFTEMTLSPERGDGPVVTLALQARWTSAGQAQETRAALKLTFPDTLDALSPAAAGRGAGRYIGAELETPASGVALAVVGDGERTAHFRADVWNLRPTSLPPPECWAAARDAPGLGTIGGESAAETDTADWFAPSAGRVTGPKTSRQLMLTFPAAAVTQVVGAPPRPAGDHLRDTHARWYLPVRIGLALTTASSTRDWGRSLYGFAVYGPQREAYAGPGPAVADSVGLSPTPARQRSTADLTALDVGDIQPDEPQAAALIELWLTVAEPPENATQLDHLRYDEWGRKVGMTYEGQAVEFDAPPEDAAGRAPTAYAWSQRTQLDSVDHCTLEQFVALRLRGAPTQPCRGRHQRITAVAVPDLTGLKRDAAVRQLEELGLRAKVVGENEAPDAATALAVREQKPAATAQLKPGAEVELTTYGAYVPPPVELPDVKGLTRDAAEAALRELGVQVEVAAAQPPPSAAEARLVTAQDPAAGVKVAPGSTVKLTAYAAYEPSLVERATAGDAEAQSKLAGRYWVGEGVEKNDKLSFEWGLKAAQQGLASAEFHVGYCYQWGRGVERNDAEAVRWHRRAAGKGQALAQDALAAMCEAGVGLPKDDAETLRLYRAAADQGVAHAQWSLGRYYAAGRGIPADPAAAAEWYRKAAEQNYAPAQESLATAYNRGEGVARDDAASAEWYRKAADQGQVLSAAMLGYLYETGEGVPKNDQEAFRWYRVAAERNDLNSMIRVADRYRRGSGVVQNYAEALRWYRLAADRGHSDGAYWVGYFHARGLAVPQSDAEAVQWFRRAAQNEHGAAQCALGVHSELGRGVPKDTAAAIQWYTKALRNGSIEAVYRIGCCYEAGCQVKKDEKAAAEHYRVAAEKGFAPAQTRLGLLYEEGRGVKKDYAQALELYRKAADQNEPAAKFRLGWVYHEGHGVKKDYAQALSWLRQAAEAGDVEALYWLGDMYAGGDGVKKDQAAAAQWYTKAAERGWAEAQFALGEAYEKGHGVAKNEKEAIRWWQLAARQGHKKAQDKLTRRGLRW